MKASSIALVLLIILLSCSPPILNALIITITSGKVKCITEDVVPTAISVASFKINHINHLIQKHNISAHVMSPDGEIIRSANNVDSGQFVFTAEMAGLYSTCFWSSVFEPGGEIEVDFDWKTGIHALHRFSGVAKKGLINAVETDLKKLVDSVNWIYTEMRSLRQREEEAQKIYEETNSRMGMLSLLSLVICLSVAGLQIWYLKNFFERKNIL